MNSRNFCQFNLFITKIKVFPTFEPVIFFFLINKKLFLVCPGDQTGQENDMFGCAFNLNGAFRLKEKKRFY